MKKVKIILTTENVNTTKLRQPASGSHGELRHSLISRQVSREGPPPLQGDARQLYY